MIRSFPHWPLFALLLLAACSSSTDDSAQEQTEESAAAGDGGAASSSQAVVARSLPCGVQSVLDSRCAQCHGATPLFGAPFSLVTRSDLLAPVASAGGKSRLEVALARVHDDQRPMPPAPALRLNASEIDALQSYFDEKTPSVTVKCDATGSPTGTTYTDLPKPDDCENTYELKAHGEATAGDQTKFQIAGSPTLDGNQYQCFYFDPPYGSDAGMYWFESILDNLPNLHHWILYGTDNKTHQDATTAGCNAAEPGAYYVAGWAPGATNGAAARDIALDMPSGPKAGLILEVHYFNNTGKPQVDGSGIRFCTGKKTSRPHLAAVHTLGSEGICVPPGGTQDVVGTCNPRTDMGDVHVTGVWPHMHKIGSNMKVSIKRVDGTTEVIHDHPFDFNAQVFFPLENVVVHPGDKVETTCSYRNDTTGQVHYGERTQDEMCYSFIAAWPAGSLTPTPSGFTNKNTAIGNRCAEDLSILQSCNGLADRPVNVSQQ